MLSTFRSSEPDQLAEADDIDSLGDFLRTWEVPEESIRRSQKILCLRSYADLERSDFPKPTPVDFDLVPGELALDNLDEEAELRNKLSKEKQQYRVTEVDPNFLVRITNKLDQRFAQSCRKDTISRTQARRPSGWYTAWDVVTCCLESIMYLSATLACSSRLPMTMIQCASGVRWLQNPRQSPGSFRYKYFVVFRRVRLPHEGSVELSAPLSIEDPGSVEPQFR